MPIFRSCRQIAKAATADAAEFLNKADDFGTISPGKRADLLLLAANPLDDVRNATQLEGVMVRGRWFTQAHLRGRLEALAASLTKRQLSRSSTFICER